MVALSANSDGNPFTQTATVSNKTAHIAPRVGMVVFSCYPDDPRVRREAEALVVSGMHVEVICLQQPGSTRKDLVNGVSVFRIPITRKRGSPARYLWEYAMFLFLAGYKLFQRNLGSKYDVVHVHNMPDVLVFSALVPRMSGAKVILDLHDPMPEVFMAKYSIPSGHAMIRALLFLERKSISFADVILTPNAAFQTLFIERGCPKEKIHVVMNVPDPAIFHRTNGTPSRVHSRSSGEFILMYHGTVVERHGLDTAVEAVAQVRDTIKNIAFHVFGDGDFVDEFKRRVKELGVQDVVTYHGQVGIEAIAATIGHVDVGIIPNKKSVFTDINFPTRIFEYLSKGKPVVAPRTRGIKDYFREDEIEFFEPGDPSDLATAILRIHHDPERSKAVVVKGMRVYERCSWPLEKARFVNVVNSLLGRKCANGNSQGC